MPISGYGLVSYSGYSCNLHYIDELSYLASHAPAFCTMRVQTRVIHYFGTQVNQVLKYLCVE